MPGCGDPLPAEDIDVSLLSCMSFFLRLSRNSLAFRLSALGLDRDCDLERLSAMDADLFRLRELDLSSSSSASCDASCDASLSASSESSLRGLVFCSALDICKYYQYWQEWQHTSVSFGLRVDVRPLDGISSPSPLSSAESISP